MIKGRIVDLMDEILDEIQIETVPTIGSTIEFTYDGSKTTSEIVETFPAFDKENHLISIEIRVNVKSPIVDED